jgi:transcriptional regulator with XRE-family HTH domain
MAQSVTHQFQAALAHLLAQEGRGAQSRLAGQQNIDRGYLNAIVKGRKPGSEEVRAKIASHFNMTYEDMLALGRGILGKGEKSGADGDTPAIGTKRRDTGMMRSKNENTEAVEERIADLFEKKKSANKALSISETIQKTVEILESDTVYRDVLIGVLDAFHQAITLEGKNLESQNQIKRLEQRMASLEEKLAKDKNFLLQSG